MRFRHVALMISDLRAAEYYYRAIFGMSVLFREAAMEPGGPHAEAWATLPPGSGWEEAEAAGVSIGMAALRRDDVVLALLAAESTGESRSTRSASPSDTHEGVPCSIEVPMNWAAVLTLRKCLRVGETDELSWNSRMRISDIVPDTERLASTISR